MYKKIIADKKLVLFDLDGTLVDSEPFWQQALSTVMNRENTFPEMNKAIVKAAGIPNLVKWQYLVDNNEIHSGKTAEQLTQETKDEFLKLIENEELEPREGFLDLAFYLKHEKNIKLGLVTNTDKIMADKILAKIGVNETFDLKIYGDDVKKPKPDPEIYYKAIKMAEVSGKEVLVFEDSPTGAAAAHNAKLDLIIIWDTETSKDLFPEETIFFLTNFQGLANNFDHTIEEAFNDFRKRVLKEPQEEVNNQQTQTQPH